MVQSFPLTQVKFCESELNISSKRLSLLYTYRGITLSLATTSFVSSVSLNSSVFRLL